LYAVAPWSYEILVSALLPGRTSATVAVAAQRGGGTRGEECGN
jgi:hypothetical protein